MNRTIKRVISASLALSVIASVAGCSLFDKANKLCTEIGDEFIQAALEREIDDMADLCIDDDEALEILAKYEDEVEAIDLLMERATFKADKAECSTKDGKGKISYVITLPDWDAALDEDPEDEDDLEDILDDLKDTTEIKLTLEFKNKKDEWYINNVDDFADDFYGELYDIDFPFGSPIASMVYDPYWYGCDSSNSGVYTNVMTIDLDIDITDWDYYDEIYYKVFYNGTEVYESYKGTLYGYFGYWYGDGDEGCFDEDGYLLAGQYTVTFYDGNNREVYSDTCTVNNTYN